MDKPGSIQALLGDQENLIDLVQRFDGAWEVPLDRATREQAFKYALDHALTQGPGAAIEYTLPYPKYLFLEWAVRTGTFLLHGSNGDQKQELLPQPANDRAKKSGNQSGVYAVTDPVLPLFYAIKDRMRFRGLADSGFASEAQVAGEPKLHYRFAVPKEMLVAAPWSSGMVYLLPRSSFVEQVENGAPTGEWVSTAPVRPTATLPVGPEDFPFLSQIEAIQEK